MTENRICALSWAARAARAARAATLLLALAACTSPGTEDGAHLRVTVEGERVKRVGFPIPYTVTVENDGTETAHGVVVEERIPFGNELSGNSSGGERKGRTVRWPLGDLEPGDSRKIEFRLLQVSRTAAIHRPVDVLVRTSDGPGVTQGSAPVP